MSAFALLILLKIAVTIRLVALFLRAPLSRLNTLTEQSGESTLIYRLYGIALLALILGYAEAFRQAQDGTVPYALVAMGVVSNGGAFFLLRFLANHPLMRVSAWVFGGIAFALVLSVLFPAYAFAPLWTTDG